MPEDRWSVIWSPEARADLEEIWAYYAEVAGLQTADDIARKIGNTCRLLETYPLGGRARSELLPGLRSLAVRPHVIFLPIDRRHARNRPGARRTA